MFAPFLAALLAATAPAAADLSAPVASGRSGAVAYLRTEGARATLFVVRDGRTTRIGTAAREGPEAQWSPDGRSLAYRDERWRLVVTGTGPSGLGGRRVLEPMPLVSTFAWSPRGDRLAYIVRGNAGAELRVVRVDGSGRRRLTQDADLLGFAWSADGRSIAYTAITAEGFSDLLEDLRVVPAEGGTNVLFISVGSKRTTCCMTWSPAGALVYALADKVGGAARFPAPYITTAPYRGDPGKRLLERGVPVSFSSQGRLLVQRGDRVVVVGPGGGTAASFAGADPAWSPAGDRIVFHRGGRVVVARANGTAARVVAPGRHASWTGADALVFQRAGCGPAAGIYTVVLGGAPRRAAAARAC